MPIPEKYTFGARRSLNNIDRIMICLERPMSRAQLEKALCMEYGAVTRFLRYLQNDRRVEIITKQGRTPIYQAIPTKNEKGQGKYGS